MQTMDASLMTELRALRARAYGRHVGAPLEPNESERLAELERALRAESGATAAPEAPGRPPVPAMPAALAAVGAPVAAPVDRATRAEAVANAEQAVTDAAEPAPRRMPRRVPVGWMVAWAASLLIVALAVGGTVFGLASIRPVSPATGAVQITTLDTPGDPSLVSGWIGDDVDGVVAYEYAGLVVARLPSSTFGALPGAECFLVGTADGFSEQDGDQVYSGISYYGCSAGAFPATVQFVVDDQVPDALREQFPDGTGLQFVLRDGAIGVFVSPASSPSPAPTA